VGSASQLKPIGSDGIAPEAWHTHSGTHPVTEGTCDDQDCWCNRWSRESKDIRAQLLMVGRLLYQERINKDILERQLSGLKMDYGNYMAIRDQQNDIATFIRQNYVMEIYRGEHAGKDLVAILRRYLGIERSRWSVKLRYWWWWLTSREGDR
jgi:hypothetical protein